MKIFYMSKHCYFSLEAIQDTDSQLNAIYFGIVFQIQKLNDFDVFFIKFILLLLHVPQVSTRFEILQLAMEFIDFQHININVRLFWSS